MDMAGNAQFTLMRGLRSMRKIAWTLVSNKNRLLSKMDVPGTTHNSLAPRKPVIDQYLDG